MARGPTCIHKERSGESYGWGIAGGGTAQAAKNVAVSVADSMGKALAEAALANKVPACDRGCEETGSSAAAMGPTKVLVSAQIMRGLWLVVVKRHWEARRECGPIEG